MLVEYPQRLAGDGIAFGRDAMSIVKNKNRSYGWFLSRESCACGGPVPVFVISSVFFAAQIGNFIGEMLDFSREFRTVAIVRIYDNRLRRRRAIAAVTISVVVAIEAGIVRKER